MFRYQATLLRTLNAVGRISVFGWTYIRGKAGNSVSRENECGAEPNGGQNKTADTFTITMVCRKFGLDVIRRNCDEKYNSKRFLDRKTGFFENLRQGFSFYSFQTFGKDDLQPGLSSIIKRKRRSWCARGNRHIIAK